MPEMPSLGGEATCDKHEPAISNMHSVDRVVLLDLPQNPWDP